MNCRYCNGGTTRMFSGGDVNRNATNQEFTVVRCVECGIFSIANPPSDLEVYYTSDYHFRPRSVADIEIFVDYQKYMLDIFKPYVERGDLLEIGPSVGIFCLMAKKAGFNVSAIEMDQGCVAFLNEQVKVRAIESSDPGGTMDAEARLYDAICLWHSLEHMSEPWKVIASAARHLKPGGVLVVACPNPVSWQAGVMGARWPHWDLPRHLHAMPIPWILKVGEENDLVPRVVTTNDRGSSDLSIGGWSMLARNTTRNPLLRRVLGRVGTEVGKRLRLWDGRERLGSCYTIVLGRR